MLHDYHIDYRVLRKTVNKGVLGNQQPIDFLSALELDRTNAAILINVYIIIL